MGFPNLGLQAAGLQPGQLAVDVSAPADQVRWRRRHRDMPCQPCIDIAGLALAPERFRRRASQRRIALHQKRHVIQLQEMVTLPLVPAAALR